jgi:hypothetical protein
MTTATPTQSVVATFVSPFAAPELYRRCKIGGIDNPGVIARGFPSDFDIISDYDVKKGKGSSGATITDDGDPPQTGKIKFLLWRHGQGDTGQPDPNVPDDFDDWDKYLKMLRAARRNKQALDIVHPIINQCEVSSVVFKRIGQLTEEGSNGLWSVTLECLKWVPQPTADGGTPAGSRDKNPDDPNAQPTDPSPNDPNAALKQEFTDKLNEASQ